MKKPADKKLEKLAGKELFRMVKHGATIDIGSYDDDDTAYPEAHVSKWDGECWFKISHKDKQKIPKNKKAKTKLKDGKLEVEIEVDGTGRKHRFREGSLEWDIEYATVDDLPTDDTERFHLEFPYDQLEFTKTKELTQVEIDNGYIQPENIINSFAGYFEKANKLIRQVYETDFTSTEWEIKVADGEIYQDSESLLFFEVIYDYGTGKFCHIYRQKMIAADGSETWIVQDIINSELQSIIPRQWCIDHGFPVTLDPIIGYDQVGGTHSSFGSGYVGGAWTCDDTGTLDSITHYCHTARTATYYASMYKEGDLSLVGYSENKINLAATTWEEYAMADEAITAIDYIILINGGTSGQSNPYSYDSGETMYFRGGLDAPPPDDPLSGYSTIARKLSQYFTFTEDALLPIEITAGSITLTGQDVFVNAAEVISIGKGAFTMTGQSVTTGQFITIEKGVFTLIGKSVTLDELIPIGNGVFTMTGKSVNLTIGEIIEVSKGVFTITGKDTFLNETCIIGNASITITGNEVTIFGEGADSRGKSKFGVHMTMN